MKNLYQKFLCSLLCVLTSLATSTAVGESFAVYNSDGAFKDCTDLTSITSEAIVPPVCGDDCFENVDKRIPVYVPYESIDVYEAADGWSDFDHILPIVKDNELWYTTTTGKAIAFDADKYSDGNLALIQEKRGDYWVITFEEPLTNIAESAFYDKYANKGLSTVVLPKCVTEIGNGAFDNCEDLEYTNLSDSLVTIGDAAFFMASLDDVLFPDGLKEIGEQAFAFCYISEISLPEGLESIGSYAFESCADIDSIYVPASVSYLGNNIVASCDGLVSIVVDPNNTHYDSRNNCNAIIDTDADILISGCIDTVIPDGVVELGISAFTTISDLTEIDIPSSVVRIDGGVFAATGLTSIQLPEDLNYLGEFVFENCQNLTSVAIPSGIDMIRERAFDGCRNLERVDFPANLYSIGRYAFSTCTKLDSVIIPEGTKCIEFGAFTDCKSITILQLPSTVEKIGQQAFASCNELKNVVLPDSLKEVEDFAFQGCINATIVAKSKTPIMAGTKTFKNTRRVFYPRYGKYDDSIWQSADNKGRKYVSLILDLEDEYSIDIFNLIDSWKEYYVPFTDERDSELYDYVTYTRNFKNHEWQPLCLPVHLPYANLSDKFEIAEISDSQDDLYELAVTDVTSGTLEPNTPYFIRLKDDYELGEYTVSSAKKIAITETIENEYETEYYTIGSTYKRLTGNDIKGKYGLVNGWFNPAGAKATLPLFRIFLDRISSGASIKLMFVHYDDTAISDVDKVQPVRSGRYNISGQSVGSNYKGVVIENGKKVLNK